MHWSASTAREDDLVLDHATEEAVVESVAYPVCASVGLDSAGSAVPYVTDWAGMRRR